MSIETTLNIGLYCSSSEWTWQEQQALQYAVWLKERGAKIVLFCLDDSPLYHQGKEERIRVERVQRNKKYRDRKNGRKVAVKLDNNKLDILFICSSWDIGFAGICKKMTSRKLNVVYHQNSEIVGKKKDFVHTKRYERLDLWITPLEILSKQIRNRTNFDPDKIRLFPTAVNVQELLFMSQSKEQARFELSISPAVELLGVKGIISPRRAQLFLTMVLPELRKKHPNLQLVIYGKKGRGEAEDYYDELVETIKRYRLEGEVHIREEVDNESAFYRAIDVFVSANKKDINGIDTIKAMLYGKRIIGVNEGGIPEYLQWGEYGELYTAGNPFGFSQAFESMKADEIRADEKAKNAAVFAKDKFDHYHACSYLETLMEGLVKPKEV